MIGASGASFLARRRSPWQQMTRLTLRNLGVATFLLTLTAGLSACMQPSNSAEMEQLRKDLADAKAAEAAKAAQAIHGTAGQTDPALPSAH